MNNRRRHRGEIRRQEFQGTRSHQNKPSHGNWQPAVPSWEKRFCYSVGLVAWKKLLETKKFMYLYENVVRWDDSAGEEAFHNAKSRFWAKINGFPCDISLPDPDIYIDEIDWNSNIDPELLLDLERKSKEPDERFKVEGVVILGNPLSSQPFCCTGWGDAEEELQKAANSALDPRFRGGDQNVGDDEDTWESNASQTNGDVKDNRWESHWNDPCRWRNNYNEWDNNGNEWNNVNDRTGGHWVTWEANTRKREGAGSYVSRYKTSRFHGDDYQRDRGWSRNGRGRKSVNFAH